MLNDKSLEVRKILDRTLRHIVALNGYVKICINNFILKNTNFKSIVS